MPLKKLLKRTHQQYNVVSKTTFVISVELLDNGVMECTLDTFSTGKDCLFNISQRLGLQQPEFFGLRYISRGVPPRERWADLDRPLKKQLDKYAQDSQLSLGVMFYVADVNVLKDEMTRYHYFLQLKSDIIEGKLNCSIDQAISLAAYSLQAEFGDFDQERHTIDYLRDFAILPKELTTQSKFQDINIDALFEAVARQYGSLIGFPPPLAEIYYIMVTQQLDGYGQTAFPAKDDSGNDILFCVSANGLAIRRRDWTHIAAFRYNDIKSLVGRKKALVLQGSQSQRSIQFHFTDPEVVKYVKKICLLQSSFYKESLKVDQPAPAAEFNMHNNNYSVMSGLNSADQIDANPNSSAHLRGVTPDTQSSGIYENQYSINNSNFVFNQIGANRGNGASLTPTNIISSDEANLQMIQQYQRSVLNNNLASNMGMNPTFLGQPQQDQFMHGFPNSSTGGLQQFGSDFRPNSRSVTPSNILIYGPGSRGVSPQGMSYLRTNTNTMLNTNPSNMELQALVPSYRAAPDYQTAIQIKYGLGETANTGKPHTGPEHVYNNEQEEEEEPIYENDISTQSRSEFSDSRPSNLLTTRSTHETGLPPQVQHTFTLSSEDPNSYLYKPPPPYPGTAHTSTSSISSATTHFDPQYKLRDGTYSKLKPTLSNHSDVLRQIEAQLSNLKLPVTAEKSADSQAGKVIADSSVAVPSTNLAANSQRSSRSQSREPTSAKSNKSSSSSSSYVKLSDQGGISSGQVSSNSSFNMSVTSLGAKAKPSHRKQIEMQKILSKTKLSMSELNTAAIDPSILKEYEVIPKAKIAPDFTTAMKRENSKRNRCPSVLPYEDNSIRLTPTRQNLDGYTNASPVSAVVSGREWKYIVGQIPLAGNIPSIWQMVWETDAKIIATLERDSTALFYPMDSSTSLSSSALNTMFIGDFQIVDSKSDKSTTSIAREVTLIYLAKKLQRKVWILPYEDEWKDDVPIHTEHFLCFLEEVNSIQRKVSDPSKPLVVLCGTGAGRSGVLILSDILLHAADSGHKLRCDNLLAELRTQRMLLVSSPAQYAFVLHTLAKYLAQSRLI